MARRKPVPIDTKRWQTFTGKPITYVDSVVRGDKDEMGRRATQILGQLLHEMGAITENKSINLIIPTCPESIAALSIKLQHNEGNTVVKMWVEELKIESCT